MDKKCPRITSKLYLLVFSGKLIWDIISNNTTVYYIQYVHDNIHEIIIVSLVILKFVYYNINVYILETPIYYIS